MMCSALSHKAAKLRDMIAGMNELGLIDFLKLNKDVVLCVLFPTVLCVVKKLLKIVGCKCVHYKCLYMHICSVQ